MLSWPYNESSGGISDFVEGGVERDFVEARRISFVDPRLPERTRVVVPDRFWCLGSGKIWCYGTAKARLISVIAGTT